MCGIFGAFDREAKVIGAHAAETMARRLHHRGPDERGFFEVDGMLVGNTRLSVIDLASGHQPMFSDDGQIAVVQNGEIYNYLELAQGLPMRTKSDTEVILRLFERDGPDFVKQLNGMFAIALLDRRAGRLLLYRDRVGKKPLYLADDGERLWFASEIKALLAVGVPRKMDPVALDALLTYNYVPPPLTMFAGIRHLPPGGRLVVDRRNLREDLWWDLAQTSELEKPLAEWEDEILATLDDAVRIRLRSDVPLGAFLSGGIDSSTVVRLLTGQLKDPVRTFTIGFEDPRFDESIYADEVAQQCGTNHTCEIVQPNMIGLWPLVTYHNDQPHGDASFMPTYRLSQLARRHVTVVLTGDGGDELFAGYKADRDFFSKLDPTISQDSFERKYVNDVGVFQDGEKGTLYTSEAAAEIRGADAFAFAAPHFKRLRHLDRVNQVLGLQTKLLLPGNNLVKPDKMAMAVSLEPRSPFLDWRMVELAFRIPGSLKLRDGDTKWIFKRAAERILPRRIVHRSKQMFTVPIGEWFKDQLLDFVREALLSHRSLERRLFRPSRIEEMIDEHRAGIVDHTRRLRLLVAVEIWHRLFIDDNFDHAPGFEELGISPVHQSMADCN